MKKFVVILLTVILCCCTFFTVSTEAESLLSAGYASGIIGENADVTISLSDNPGVAAIYFQAFYDTSLLTLTSVEDLGVIDDFQYYDNAGTVTFSWEPAIENTFANGDLAILHFEIASTATECITPITLSPISHGIINKSGNDVDINLISGTIQICNKPRDISSSTLAIDTTDNYISCISEGTTVGEILAGLDSSEDIILKNGETQLKNQDTVSTGTKLFVYEKGEIVREYTLIVTGDNSGDGKITVKDLINLQGEIFNPNLDDVYKIACDLNGDKTVNADDLNIMKSHILHSTKIVGIAYLQ